MVTMLAPWNSSGTQLAYSEDGNIEILDTQPLAYIATVDEHLGSA